MSLDAKIFGKVAVMFGGESAERTVSLNSGAAVLNALISQGVDAHKFDPKDSPLTDLTKNNFDRVFIVLHGRGGEDGALQGALSYMGLPFTGTGAQGSAFAMDKVRSKYLFLGAQLPTAPFFVVNKGDNFDCQQILNQLSGKVMVKPANEGSSIGMGEAHSVEQLESAINNAFNYDSEVLVEQWVTGREVTVSILNGVALPIIEMRTSHEFYDYDAKYITGDTEYLCPAPLGAELTKEVQDVAVKVFNIVGGSGWGRVDFIIGENNQLNVLEVNTVPGMTETSLVPKAAAANNIDFSSLVINILKGTL
ncbi:D-alanine--D-alanine ligase [uncultured Psychrosphaera sp.]|jgi:D-alanine-D-alanine ligase|uniref:D-alanine--D-alanine ligase n=1 Tax=uncultured Psychrosphaera sp. TaxID=1403522 RepID=UPI00260BF469|nr:D-alanine--D-alanine ligase [uncultured Psychrosphaera sp.]